MSSESHQRVPGQNGQRAGHAGGATEGGAVTVIDDRGNELMVVREVE